MPHNSEQIDLSIIIPTYNFQTHLGALWMSLKQSSLDTIAKEIVFVNDGSSDQTDHFLRELQNKNKYANIKIISFKENQGRFKARLEGARQANGEFLFFVDSRIKLPDTASAFIKKHISKNHCLMADIKIDETEDIFSLYWQRTHERIFSGSFKSKLTSFYITKDNFHQHLSGTGAFIVPRSTFLQCAELFDPSLILSDDNALLEKIVAINPIFFDPDFYANWKPRNNFLSFVIRMFERGPSFVEYHVFKNHGIYFGIVLLALCFCVGLLFMAIYLPLLALIFLTTTLLAIIFSTVIFSRSIGEFFSMIPVHVGTILFFGFGILWGLLLNSWKFIKSGGTMGYSK